MEIRDLLNKKGDKIYTISPDATVYEAISKMNEHGIGALLVMDGNKLKGIISERDYLNGIALKGRTSKETRVHEVMTKNPTTLSLSESVEDCMHAMTEKRFRHLPVVENDEVKGIISIGDIVKSIIDKQKDEIEGLKGYISGSYPG